MIPYQTTKNNPRSTSVPTIQTVRGRVVFFAKCAKQSPLLNPWPSGFLPLPFRRRKLGTGFYNPAHPRKRLLNVHRRVLRPFSCPVSHRTNKGLPYCAQLLVLVLAVMFFSKRCSKYFDFRAYSGVGTVGNRTFKK